MDRDQQAPLDWQIYNQRQEFEHGLIDRKISWFLTIQGILFAAYGIALGNSINIAQADTFQKIVARIGLVLGIVTCIGVAAVINSKWKSFRYYKAFCTQRRIAPLEPHNASEVQWGVNTFNTWITLLPDVVTPVLFIVGWALLL